MDQVVESTYIGHLHWVPGAWLLALACWGYLRGYTGEGKGGKISNWELISLSLCTKSVLGKRSMFGLHPFNLTVVWWLAGNTVLVISLALCSKKYIFLKKMLGRNWQFLNHTFSVLIYVKGIQPLSRNSWDALVNQGREVGVAEVSLNYPKGHQTLLGVIWCSPSVPLSRRWWSLGIPNYPH